MTESLLTLLRQRADAWDADAPARNEAEMQRIQAAENKLTAYAIKYYAQTLRDVLLDAAAMGARQYTVDRFLAPDEWPIIYQSLNDLALYDGFSTQGVNISIKNCACLYDLQISW